MYHQVCSWCLPFVPPNLCFPHPTLPAQESFLWPLASVGLAIGICCRRWEGVKEGVRSGYFLPWLLRFKMSSGQMCSSGRSHWTSRWPTPRDCFQFPLTSPSACFFGPRGDGICWWWHWVTALSPSSHRLLAGTLIGWAGDYSSLFGLWVSCDRVAVPRALLSCSCSLFSPFTSCLD